MIVRWKDSESTRRCAFGMIPKLAAGRTENRQWSFSAAKMKHTAPFSLFTSPVLRLGPACPWRAWMQEMGWRKKRGKLRELTNSLSIHKENGYTFCCCCFYNNSKTLMKRERWESQFSMIRNCLKRCPVKKNNIWGKETIIPLKRVCCTTAVACVKPITVKKKKSLEYLSSFSSIFTFKVTLSPLTV